MCELRAVVILTVAIHCGVMWKGGIPGRYFYREESGSSGPACLRRIKIL